MDLANIRMAVSNDKGLNHASTYQRTYAERQREEVIGACGEMAYAKSVNRFFSPTVNTFHGTPDVGSVEVRATERMDGSLIVRDNDADDRWYVLVVGEPPNMKVVGAIKGSEAKQSKWLRNPHGHRKAWFVPQNELLSS